MSGNLLTRRDLLRAGVLGGASFVVAGMWRNVAHAAAADDGRILVILELAGGCDGLNTLVPYRNDAYYEARPTLGLEESSLLKADSELGFHPRLFGIKNLWDRGQVSVIHGCGYPNPIRSHFLSMAYWHSATPGAGNPYGWVGRFADAKWPAGRKDTLVNIATRESLAVRSARHAPLVFDDVRQLVRAASPREAPIYDRILRDDGANQTKSVAFLRDVSRMAEASSDRIRSATARYETSVSYGESSGKIGQDLRKVAALIRDEFPARVYYVQMTGFDTHSAQLDAQNLLFMYLGDALEGFLTDMKHQGRAGDVAVMAFTEFGRRVAENNSGGTDHGTATPMWLFGEPVTPGFHGTYPSLTDLDDGDLKMTMDFRRVYASVLEEWMGLPDAGPIIGDGFEPLGLFRGSGV
jgi:uncharacterized protein (DUF1501 family)